MSIAAPTVTYYSFYRWFRRLVVLSLPMSENVQQGTTSRQCATVQSSPPGGSPEGTKRVGREGGQASRPGLESSTRDGWRGAGQDAGELRPACGSTSDYRHYVNLQQHRDSRHSITEIADSTMLADRRQCPTSWGGGGVVVSCPRRQLEAPPSSKRAASPWKCSPSVKLCPCAGVFE